VVSFQIEAWTAMAPGLEQQEDWKTWLTDPQPIDSALSKQSLKQLPPLLRRRFNTLGKCAVGAALNLLKDGEQLPSIFASRHGDTELTLSLLEDMGRDEPMSPTGFSLAVHNAVSGLYSIARKDVSAVTAIASMEGLIISALLEAIGQLQTTERVLCIIYDVPLPELYQPYTSSVPFPYAIAMVLNRTQGEAYTLEQCLDASPVNKELDGTDLEFVSFLKLLTGLSANATINVNDIPWSIKKVATDDS